MSLYCFLDSATTISTCRPPLAERCLDDDPANEDSLQIYGIPQSLFHLLDRVNSLAYQRRTRIDDDSERAFRYSAKSVADAIDLLIDFAEIMDGGHTTEASHASSAFKWAMRLRLAQVVGWLRRYESRYCRLTATYLTGSKTDTRGEPFASNTIVPTHHGRRCMLAGGTPFHDPQATEFDESPTRLWTHRSCARAGRASLAISRCGKFLAFWKDSQLGTCEVLRDARTGGLLKLHGCFLSERLPLLKELLQRYWRRAASCHTRTPPRWSTSLVGQHCCSTLSFPKGLSELLRSPPALSLPEASFPPHIVAASLPLTDGHTSRRRLYQERQRLRSPDMHLDSDLVASDVLHLQAAHIDLGPSKDTDHGRTIATS